MTGNRPTLEELNAYVDRELAAADAARVARAVAEDADLASQVAMLSRLKAVAGSEHFEMPEIALPPGRPAGRVFAMAAAVATLLLVGAFAVWIGDWRGEEPDWLDTAQAAHAGWAGRAAPGDRAGAGTVQPAQVRMGPGAHIPLLTAAKLSIAYVRSVAARPGGADALHVGYVGTRGCRVSLWISRLPLNSSDVLIRHRRAGRTFYAWQAGDLAYAMFASGMESRRFDLIVHAAFKATRARARPDADMRTALRRSRENSPPCVG